MAGPDGSPRMDVSFQKTIPIFRIFDVMKAKEFYVGFLGFIIEAHDGFRGGASRRASKAPKTPLPRARTLWMNSKNPR